MVDEFKPFLERFGAASNYFSSNNPDIEMRQLARFKGVSVGVVFERNAFFLPALLPEKRPDAMTEYFQFLANGLSAYVKRSHNILPDWIKGFTFAEEPSLTARRASLQQELLKIETEFDLLTAFKSVLALTGEELVSSVAAVFQSGFGFKIDMLDELKEDFKVLDASGKPLVFVEVKGINGGLKREYINQADSHRERAGVGNKMPTILVINTKLKGARSLVEKDQELANEQVTHAANMGILVIRSLDLLWLLHMYRKGGLSQSEVLGFMTSNVGWLRVDHAKIQLSA